MRATAGLEEIGLELGSAPFDSRVSAARKASPAEMALSIDVGTLRLLAQQRLWRHRRSRIAALGAHRVYDRIRHVDYCARIHVHGHDHAFNGSVVWVLRREWIKRIERSAPIET